MNLCAIILPLALAAPVLPTTSTAPSSQPSAQAAKASPIPVPQVAAPIPSPAQKPSHDPEKFFTFYAANLRGSLFSGFLTLGSFLVAVNTFLIVNLKKEVYDHATYKQRVHDAKQGNPSASFFGPLRRLAKLLLATIVLCLSTAVAQLTVGVLFTNWISAAICIGLAGVSILLLAFVLWKVHQNLTDWFDFIETTAEKDYQQSKEIAPAHLGSSDKSAPSS